MVLAFCYFTIAVSTANYLLVGFEKYINLPSLSVSSFVDYLLAPIAYLGAATGYKIFKKWMADNERLNQLRNEQLKEELNQLKNQVNPHFLFNTLNNLDTLIQTDSKRASQVVLGLSDILRYQIYESNRDHILLSKDIDMLYQYLLLEKIRRDRFNYEILVESKIDGVLLPPLIFINFVDNALKHSLDNRNASYVRIKFNIIDKRLFFEIENSKPSFITQRETGGFGLKNIKRRLDLLYEKNYDLILTDEPNKYTVSLNIPL
jgi:LytS/YehU family sensor histidine kinase